MQRSAFFGTSWGWRPEVVRGGERLERPVRRWLERCFRADLGHVRVHTDSAAARIVARAGAVALAHGADLLFAPGYFDPDTDAGRRILAHEVAHVLQQRRPRKSDPVRATSSHAWLEAEADAAARAVVAGRAFHVAPVTGCPDWQPMPWLVVLGVAAAAGLLFATCAPESDVQEDAADPNEHLYETGWGYIPFVGSLSEVWSGRSRFERGIGMAFLVLDLSLIGGVVVRGIISPLARRGAAAAVEKGAQKTAFAKIVELGGKVGTKEEVSQAIVAAAKGTGQSVVLASTEGWRNHAVSYLITKSGIWKMHGGISKLMIKESVELTTEMAKEAVKKGTKTAAQWAEKIVGKANALSIYRIDDAVAKTTIEWWEQQLKQRAFTLFTSAEGCAGTQALLLKQIGVEIPGVLGGSRFLHPLLPLFLDLHRGAAGVGTHVVSGGGKIVLRGLGTAVQLFEFFAPRNLAWLGAGTYDSVDNTAPRGGIKPVVHGIEWGKDLYRRFFSSNSASPPSSPTEVPMAKFAASVLAAIPPYELIPGLVLNRVNAIELANGLAEGLSRRPFPPIRPLAEDLKVGVSPPVADALATLAAMAKLPGEGALPVTDAEVAAAGAQAALTVSIEEDMKVVLKVAKELQLKNVNAGVLFDEIYSRAGLPVRRAILALVALHRASTVKATFEGRKEGLPFPREVRVTSVLRSR